MCVQILSKFYALKIYGVGYSFFSPNCFAHLTNSLTFPTNIYTFIPPFLLSLSITQTSHTHSPNPPTLARSLTL